MYEKRFYRTWTEHRPLHHHELKIEESDLLLLFDNGNDAARLIAEADQALRRVRTAIKRYIHAVPSFAHALTPTKSDPDAPRVISDMIRAGQIWNVGPMAAVAGTVAEYVARAVHHGEGTVIVENGGDIFALSEVPVRFGLYAGEASPFKSALTFEVAAGGGVSICTSSGRIGPSFSKGSADAAVAIHRVGAVADAAATSIANRIRHSADVDAVVQQEQSKNRLRALISCMDDRLGMWGEISLIKN
jgi:ApbE superfamily uncharacterized protein (UPF0280 family)